jgi:hypothetical protein
LLSDADRERVRLEEVFREEVRKSLEKPKTAKKKVYDFFNSSLGIFILSSILLASLSAGVTKWLEINQREAQAAETIRRLDIEIAHRLQQLPVLSSGVITYTQMHTAKGAVFGKAENHPQVGKLGEFEPIFPEFLGRTLFFLIWELQRTLRPEQRPQFDRALTQARLLPAFFDRMALVKPRGGDDSQWAMPEKDRTPFNATLAALQLSRWRP